MAGICTYSNPEVAFSYRRSKVTGRLGTVASLLSPPRR
ncbi:MAG: laccase domain-containing protein [Waddliaceae bacterium]